MKNGKNLGGENIKPVETKVDLPSKFDKICEYGLSPNANFFATKNVELSIIDGHDSENGDKKKIIALRMLSGDTETIHIQLNKENELEGYTFIDEEKHALEPEKVTDLFDKIYLKYQKILQDKKDAIQVAVERIMSEMR